MIDIIALFLKAFIGVIWGIGENRLWKEHGENFILNHFTTYHFFMAVLFGAINSIGISWGVHGLIEWGIWMLWDVLMLDVAWWIIRYLDLTHLGMVWGIGNTIIWKFPLSNNYDSGLGKPWHSKDDWDNWLGLPLIFGTYWWWWLFSLVIILLGTGYFSF
jgi:hypothetical protein